MTIAIDNFVLNFKPIILKNKIESFNEDPKEVGGEPICDLDMALWLDQIVNKYDYAIEDYLAVRYMIDS